MSMQRARASRALFQILSEAAFRLRCALQDLNHEMISDQVVNEEILTPAAELIEKVATSLEQHIELGSVSRNGERLRPVEAALRGAIAHASAKGIDLTHELLFNHEGRWTAGGQVDPLQAYLILYQPQMFAEQWPETYVVLARALEITPQEVEAISSGLAQEEPPNGSLRDWYDLGVRLCEEEIAPRLTDDNTTAPSPTDADS